MATERGCWECVETLTVLQNRRASSATRAQADHDRHEPRQADDRLARAPVLWSRACERSSSSAPGGPEVLKWREVPTPEPGRGEVRVRVRATAVNRADLLQRMGLYPAPPDAPQQIPGLEFAGEIDALGAGVDRAGRSAIASSGSSAAAPTPSSSSRTTDCVARMPDALSFTDAAAIPEAFITAWDAMVSQAGLGAGETVLIHAVGSGVGTAAVQIARALSARPLGTARTADKLARAASSAWIAASLVENGQFADDVLRATGGRGVDVVLELVGGAYVAEDLACAGAARAHRARRADGRRARRARSRAHPAQAPDRSSARCCARARSRRRSRSRARSRATWCRSSRTGALQPIVERVMPLAGGGRRAPGDGRATKASARSCWP